jgi:methylamine dehydrogenase heavy chain
LLILNNFSSGVNALVRRRPGLAAPGGVIQRPGVSRRTALAALAFLAFGPDARAQGVAEPVGEVLTLPATPGPHWIWMGDFLLRRAALIDADRGDFLGTIDGGHGIVAPHVSPDRTEIYLAETHFSRSTRGERTDLVSVWDARTLSPVAEIEIPPKRADHGGLVAASALSDDGRFLAVFNMTPATSLSIVDLKARRFAGEIATPGCSLVYGAGARRFFLLCGDGTALAITLDEDGNEASRERTEKFFDPETDPVTEKAVRAGDEWLFVSFGGRVHPVDVSGPSLRLGEKWMLFSDREGADGWQVGGAQHLAAHAATGRLFALVHQGGPDGHKDPGTQIWVYDLARRARTATVPVRNPLAGVARQMLDLPAGGRAARVLAWLLDTLAPNPGVDRILVTQDAAPVLLAASSFPATLAVHDATTGAFLRDVPEVGIAGGLLVAP